MHDRSIQVHESSIVHPDAVVGQHTRIWQFCHIMEGASVGERCVIGQNVMIGPGVSVGNGVKIQNNVSVFAGVTIEDDVFCGPGMVFTNVLTPRAFVERKDSYMPTLVRRGATIGANATIICGATIGQYAMVGAAAVVTHDVIEHALVIGAPARRIGWVSRIGERLGDDLICPWTAERYRVTSKGLAIEE